MSTTIDIIHVSKSSSVTSTSHTKRETQSFIAEIGFFSIDKKYNQKLIHSFKVGFALVLVSLLYILDPPFEQVGENAMWAIMTIEVIFEFFAGATLSKGLLRGIGTIFGVGLGCLVKVLANNMGTTGNTVFIGTLIFMISKYKPINVAVSTSRSPDILQILSCAMAAYCRFIPTINKRYDYGVLIFILGSSIQIALLIYPSWASDELLYLTSSMFSELACCIEECKEAYFSIDCQRESYSIVYVNSCKSVLHSESSDESLHRPCGNFIYYQVNFARWEPWRVNFGFCSPWEKYQQIQDLLRELASMILSLEGCLRSPLQPSTMMREAIKERCKNVGSLLGLVMRELGESIMKKKKSQVMMPELQSIKLQLMLLSTSKTIEDLAIANFLVLLMEIVDKVEVLAKEVETLGEVAGF
ncbi:aluminum-activated malate transporter [Artemisia annua]|uniref:Aluminum-activated malate transporter n=1 Tax=Artemisia annua TaxID=35608 RepID=A0A2U1QP69_ARTAN|nr:aluminum-activated malate transporter [Artemisia annua]